jgi:hypothetical protein
MHVRAQPFEGVHGSPVERIQQAQDALVNDEGLRRRAHVQAAKEKQLRGVPRSVSNRSQDVQEPAAGGTDTFG